MSVITMQQGIGPPIPVVSLLLPKGDPEVTWFSTGEQWWKGKEAQFLGIMQNAQWESPTGSKPASQGMAVQAVIEAYQFRPTALALHAGYGNYCVLGIYVAKMSFAAQLGEPEGIFATQLWYLDHGCGVDPLCMRRWRLE